MATIAEMREKLKKLNEKRGGGGSRSKWFPKDHHVVRLLPISGQDEPYRVIYFHYLNRKPVYCPLKNGGQPCEVCALSDALKEWDDDKDPEVRKTDFKTGCSLEAGPKYYHPMVERIVDKDTKKVSNSGPFWWSLSESVWKEVVEIGLKDDVVQMHVESGSTSDNVWDALVNTKFAFDIEVDLKKANNEDKKGNTKSFNVTDVSPKMRETPLTRDAEELEKLLGSVPAFDTIETALSSEEVARILETYLNSGAPEEKSKSDGTEKGADVESRNAEMPGSGKKSVEEALKDLL